MTKKIYLLGVLMLLTGLKASAQTLFINEFSSSNSVFRDEDGNTEDWIEIYNNSNQSISLLGYGLSDNVENPYKWIFPDTIIESQAYFLIWASGKNKKIVGAPLHTSWRIGSTKKETLILTDNIGNILDQIETQPLLVDISLGRYPNGVGQFFYYKTASPGLPNLFEGRFFEILSEVNFSRLGGFYNNSFFLDLYHQDSSASIIYTLDGSEPDEYNLMGNTFFYKNYFPYEVGDTLGDLLEENYKSHIYQSSLSINENNTLTNTLFQKQGNYHTNYDSDIFQANFYSTKAVVIRAKAIKQGAINSITSSHTYFINFPFQTSMPIVSIVIPEKELFSYQEGIYTPGIDFDNWRGVFPEDEYSCLTAGNYLKKDLTFEKRVNFEYFEKDEISSIINQEVGLRIHGNCTRSFPIKSLRLMARNKYNQRSIKHQFFETKNINEFKRLILRSGGDTQFSTILKEGLIQMFYSKMKLATQAIQPTLLFLNGEFWGIHNIRERYDKYYFESNFGVQTDNLLLYEGTSTEDTALYENESYIDYQALKTFVQNNDMSLENNFEQFLARADLENFIDYMISVIFSSNNDWGAQNIKAWRSKNISNNTMYQDAKWRWVVFDEDDGFGEFSSIDSILYWNEDIAAVFNSLSEINLESLNWLDYFNAFSGEINIASFKYNENFKVAFINRFCDILNSHLKQERINHLTDSLAQIYRPFIERHSNRWGYPIILNEGIEMWEKNIELIKNYADQKSNLQFQQLKEYFELDNTYYLKLDVSNEEHGFIKVNTINIHASTPGVPVNTYSWLGKYFKSIPINLEAIANEGWIFSHWEGFVNNNQNSINLINNHHDTIYLKAVFLEEIVDNNDSKIIYYWHFNDWEVITTDFVFADYNFMGVHSGKLFYAGNGTGYMDLVSEGSNLNLHFSEVSKNGLRVRNPSANRFLTFDVSTEGYKDIVFTYASKRTKNGAKIQQVEYSVGNDIWEILDTTFLIQEEYKSYTIPFKNMPSINNNPNFKIRISFHGNDIYNSSGNNRFDNIVLYGNKIQNTNIEFAKNENLTIYPNPTFDYITISEDVDFFELYDIKGRKLIVGNEKTFSVQNLTSGVYFLSVEKNNLKHQYKIVKH